MRKGIASLVILLVLFSAAIAAVGCGEKKEERARKQLADDVNSLKSKTQ